MAFEIPKTLKPVFDFVIHIVVGSVGFLVLLGTTALISVIVKALDGIVPHWIEATAEYAEMGLFWTDFFLFGLFSLSEAIRLIRGLWRE